MFRPHASYTHRRMLDAGILVLTSFRDGRGRYQLRVRWVTRRGTDLGEVERITVTPDQLSKWQEFSPG